MKVLPCMGETLLGVSTQSIPVKEVPRLSAETLASSITLNNEKGLFWVGTWRDVANAEHVDANLYRQVENLLAQSLDLFQSDVYTSNEQRKAYAQSLTNFIKTQYQTQQSDDYIKGVAYWLVYCALEADQRYTSKIPCEIDKYQEAFKHISDRCIRAAFKRVLSQDEYTKWSPQIEKELEALEPRLIDYVKTCQADFLCPFFRGNIKDEDIKNIENLEKTLQWFMNDVNIPHYVSPPNDLLGKKNEYFLKEIGSFFKNAGYDGVLYSLAIYEINPRVNLNPYWGYMLWCARNNTPYVSSKNPLRWPIIVQITQDKTMNEIKHWHKGK